MEYTFVLLRYFLGEFRPKKTTQIALSYLFYLKFFFTERLVFHFAFDRYKLIYPKNYQLLLHISGYKNNTSFAVKVLGSFRPSVHNGNLHPYFNFTKLKLKTVKKSCCHSCRTPIMCQGILLP